MQRIAAWRVLSDCHDPVALSAFTASPALSVALAGGTEYPALADTVSRYLASDPGKRAFATLSSLTPVVDPLLQKWLAAIPPVMESEPPAEQETWEIRALEDEVATLEALLQQPQQPLVAWKFALTCRLLFHLRPRDLLPFVTGSVTGAEQDRRLALCSSCLPIGGIDSWTEGQALAASQVLEKSGNVSAAARVLLAKGVPQNLDFRLAFAEAVRKGDEEALIKLWSANRGSDEMLLRMIHVYGGPEGKISIGLVKRMLEARKV